LPGVGGDYESSPRYAEPDLSDDFVACYHPENRDGRWRRFSYEELLQRDKVSLDIFWVRDQSLEDSANLPDPDLIAAEIVEDLRSALEEFEGMLAEFAAPVPDPSSH
jgi:type I restriction enzyme M protein